MLRRSQRAGVFLSPDALRAPLARKRRERRRAEPAAPEIGLDVPFQGCGPTRTADGVVTCEREDR